MLSDLKIRTGNGEFVPFDMIADVDFRSGVTQIRRTDRDRTVLVTAREIGPLSCVKKVLQRSRH